MELPEHSPTNDANREKLIRELLRLLEHPDVPPAALLSLRQALEAVERHAAAEDELSPREDHAR